MHYTGLAQGLPGPIRA